jgi:hypothetical protein
VRNKTKIIIKEYCCVSVVGCSPRLKLVGGCTQMWEVTNLVGKKKNEVLAVK